jgi:hypothetical protein
MSVLQIAGKAFTKQFLSTVQTGNGAQQTIPHGLGRVPDQIVLIPQAGITSISQTATADATNVYVTATNTGTYVVLAVSSPRGSLNSGVN